MQILSKNINNRNHDINNVRKNTCTNILISILTKEGQRNVLKYQVNLIQHVRTCTSWSEFNGNALYKVRT